jgi:hypothetical protein
MQGLWGLLKKPVKYINFEGVQICVKNPTNNLIINTMLISEQKCLIRNTVPYDQEENLINDLLSKGISKKIVIYGKNVVDESTDKKYHQLLSLGFSDVYVYRGGMFEWLLLQDIYGSTEFPTTSKILDILAYRPMIINK